MTKNLSTRALTKSLFITAALLLLVLLVSFIFHDGGRMREINGLYRSYASDTAKQRLAAIGSTMRDYVLSGLGSVIALATSVLESPDADVLQERLVRFVNDHDHFHFARYVSPDGVRIEAGRPAFSPGEEDPFPELAALSEERGHSGLVASRLYELPQVVGDSTWVIYVYVPLVYQETFRGALELGFAVDPLFAEVARAERDAEILVLLDNEGNYLVSPSNEPPRATSFFEDYPHVVTGKIFGENKTGVFTHDGTVFTFRHSMIPGIQLGDAEDNHWVLLSIADEARVYPASNRYTMEHMGASITFTILIAMLAAVLGALWRVASNRYVKK